MKRASLWGLLCLATIVTWSAWADLDYRHPRPSGRAEAGAPPKAEAIDFASTRELAGVAYDLVAQFPKDRAPEFEVTRVTVNGADQSAFLVLNDGVLNGNRRVHGVEDFAIYAYAGWQPAREYRVEVEGRDGAGRAVKLAQAQTAPAEREAVKSISFQTPTAEDPYHHAVVVLGKEAVNAGNVSLVKADGERTRDARYFQEGRPATDRKEPPTGESYEGVVDGERDLRVVIPVNWINGSAHTFEVTIAPESGEPQVFQMEGKAPEKGGYWNAAWPHYHSLVVSEHAGVQRRGEPVHAAIGLFMDEIGDPHKEMRVVTYEPRSPQAGEDGYVAAPFQINKITVWNDEELLNRDERDAETGERVHRFDATTTVEFVFLADVQPYEHKVYQVLYGNPDAEALPAPQTDLKVTNGEGLSQTVDNTDYRYFLSVNSGSVEQVFVKGEGEEILLEHKLETNGAVHWNPCFYSPPTPWVHLSDWEEPHFDQISGPLMHRTERHGPMPFAEDAPVNASYEFYAGQPYTLMTTMIELLEDHFVQAFRNGEVVFNQEVLNEFVWQDERGTVQSLEMETSRRHPIHALEIPAETLWMAFINRERGVGFAGISIAYENGNRYAQLPSVAQPYFYVQNGPWVYWSRPIVYPFGGKNFTRMMPVRKGAFAYEKMAWLPFRFSESDDDPFAVVKETATKLTHPLHVLEYMPTNPRTPETWVMPILTEPFDEGVAGAVSAHKPVGEQQGNEE